MLTQPVLPLGERAHCQLMPKGPSPSLSSAVTWTLAWVAPVSVVSVTVPGSSTFSTEMSTVWVPSMFVDALPAPSLPSWTSTVTL